MNDQIMKVLFVHNDYGAFSGEEIVLKSQVQLLQEHGHEVFWFRRGSSEIDSMFLGKIRAFFSGIYSYRSRNDMRTLLKRIQPEIVHVHNVFPLISPSVFLAFAETRVPVAMTVHNYRLVCPNGLHLPKGGREICEKCCRGSEYWCVLRNCEQSLPKSLGYALRTYVARRLGFFRKNVTLFACLTEFQRKRLIAEGYPAERLQVVPNMYPADTETGIDRERCGDFVAYVGRISPEKGIKLLLSAAESLWNIPFRLAGSYNAMPEFVDCAPANVAFLGNVDREHLPKFFSQSRFLVLCSTWFEGFPMAILEAMVHAKPVICSRIGGLPEIVDDGVTGLLFEPGNAVELAEKIRYLWHRPDLCRQMGLAGREKALREYSPGKYYERLMEVYKKAMKLGPPHRDGHPFH